MTLGLFKLLGIDQKTLSEFLSQGDLVRMFQN